jgi:hypothetical protein
VHGFSAIAAGNGWLISLLGLSVVFTGLASLALIISFLPRILAWWSAQSTVPPQERLKRFFRRPEIEHITNGAGETIPAAALHDAETTLRLITARLGTPFKLPRLLEVAERHGLARPHSAINELILNGTLVGGNDGLFRWSSTTKGEKTSSPQSHTGQNFSRGSE